MNSFESKSARPDPACSAEKKSKKPYNKPTFQLERVFEVSALQCGKTGTQRQCHGRGKS